MTMMSRLGAIISGKESASRTKLSSDPMQREIHLADRARDEEEWHLAEKHYEAALSQQSSLSHIWVQLGHMLKEQDKLARSSEAYMRALEIDPSDTETRLHLAHIFKRLGRRMLAIRHFLLALRGGVHDPKEQQELLTLIAGEVQNGSFDKLAGLVAELDQEPLIGEEAPFLARLRSILAQISEETGADREPDGVDSAIVFDVSDLIAFWQSARLPTGIQRVQIETITAEFNSKSSSDVLLCCFTSGRDNWLEVPTDRFRELVKLATSGGDTDDDAWQQAISDLKLYLMLAKPFVFPMGSTLINLGTSWWLQNYFLYVRDAKMTRGVRYIPFVHDMIPIMAPEHCTRALTQDFISWALGVFDHADHFLANSEATRRDLIAVASELGHTVDPSNVAVIPLNSDFRKEGVPALAQDELNEWKIEPGNFVLFVSTIESRKGHLLAFEAWANLIEKHGVDKIPKLVCVGNRGWLNDRIYERLYNDPVLSKHVVMLSRLSDAELALLYRTCRFTIYPSLYEGWGLPVTESLCYSKVPLISDAASLPEAGGEFAVYAAAGSIEELTLGAERLILEDDYRESLEARIEADFAPRTWSDVAEQILAELDAFTRRDKLNAENETSASQPSVAFVGRWHEMTRNTATSIWPGMSSGEKYRASLGWFWPEDRGCRVKGEHGDLLFRVNRAHSGMRIAINLRADENEPCEFEIHCGAVRTAGTISRDQELWAWLDLPAASEATEYRLQCFALRQAAGNLPTYFVKGFYLRELEDHDARVEFLEAVTLGRLDLLDAFGEGQSDGASREANDG
ncbi:MAG: glycosyltransferase [Pseudomonadota bacterium]